MALGATPPCPNPYFPMEAGLQLTYRAGKSEFLYKVTEVTPTAEGLDGVLEVRIKDRVGQTHAKCTAKGVETELGGIEGMALQASGMDAKVLSSEGLAMPPPDELKSGAAWKNKLELELKPPPNVKLLPGMKIRTAFAKEAKVIAEEDVTTPAGTFHALKLLNKTTASSGGTGGDERAVESFLWLAPGVGIIKIQTNESIDLELLKVDRPAAAEKAPTKKARGKQRG